MKRIPILGCCAVLLVSTAVYGAVPTGDFYEPPRVPQQRIVLLQESSPAWVSLWQKARGLALDGDYRAALNQYEFLLRSKPDVALIRWEMASILLARHEFEQAAALLEMLVEEFPGRVEYLNGLGYAMQETGRFDRAVELFNQAEKNEPENIVSLTGMSQCLLSTGRLRDALPYLERLHVRRADDAVLRAKLVDVYVQLGFYDKARPLADQLTAGKNASAADLRAAARIYAALGQSRQAERYWNLLLDKSPADGSAHAWLATRLEEKGSCGESLEHLLFLLEIDKENPEILARVGRCYLQIKEPARALPYFRKYLEFYPRDKEISEKLVNIHASLDDEEETLAALEYYFQLEPNPSPIYLRRAARLYDGAGRYQDAIPIYRRLLLEHAPDDIELLDLLAHDLLASGSEEETLKVWGRLASVSPERAKIYHRMLGLLLQLDRRDDLHDVLKQLHELEPGDTEVTLRLVSSFISMGKVAEGETVFQGIAEKELKQDNLLEIRAGIFESLAMNEHALRDYEAVLRNHDERKDLHLKSLQLAAAFGKLNLARRHYLALEKAALTPQDQLAVANAFRDGFDFETAYSIYQEMTGHRNGDKELRSRAYMELGASYEMQGLDYEAEQSLRMAFFADAGQQVEVLARLVDLKLHKGLFDDAGIWLAQMRFVDSLSVRSEGGNDRNFLRKLMLIRQFNADEKYSVAIRKAIELQREIREYAAKDRYRGVPVADLATLELAGALLATREHEEAEKQCLSLLSGETLNFPALLLLKKIYENQGNVAAASDINKRIKVLAGKDLGRMLLLTGLYHESGAMEQMEQTARAAQEMAQDSFSASFCLATAYNRAGKHAQSRELINLLQREYPDNQAIHSLAARVAFAMGFNQEALSYCDSVLARYPDRADIQLLKARVYWRKLDWKNSFRIYEQYLTPSAGALLVQQSAASDLKLPQEPPPTIWQRLTFVRSSGSRFIDQVMSPVFLATPGEERINMLAVPLFSRYMWQQRFTVEMAARRLVEQRDDFQAVNQFDRLVKEYPEDESLLFDLAGIYSRLGKLGEEALLYERLAGIDPDYPGLNEASERNRLKRMPRVSLAYHYQEENGWDGYKAIRKDSADFASWASIKPGSDAGLSLSRIKYSDVDSDRDILANRAVIAYDANVFDRLAVRFGGGLETSDGKFDDTEIIECGLTGKVGDRLQGEFTYARDVVDDTLASLTRNIVYENYKGGLFLGILPRLITGGDYGYTNYSDGNEVKGYSIWTSYIIFPEPTSLQFKFKYDFLDAREPGNRGGVLLADGFSALDHPYWAPANYWKNSYNILWKHKLSADTLERGTPSYYSAEFMLDYDSQGHVIQTIKGGFFLELTRNFMLESAIRLVNSDEYRNRDFILSTVWRW